MSAEANKPATTGGVSKFCSQCGTRGEVDWKFCQQCGAKVGAGTHTDECEEKTKYKPGAFTLKVDLPGGDREDMAVRIGDRLVYDFERQREDCCNGDDMLGCHQDVGGRLPAEMKEKGIGAEEWRQWIEELNGIQETKAPSENCLLCLVSCPLLCPQMCVCLFCCPVQMDHKCSALPCCFGDWHSALRQWMDTVNSRLEPMGLFTKILTYEGKNAYDAPRSRLFPLRTEVKKGDLSNYQMSFLVFALTEAESQLLKAESWNHGVDIVGLFDCGRAV